MLGINKDPVTIKSIELAIVDRAFDEGWIVPEPPATRTWKKVAVIGSGPAGLAAAAQLNRAGHSVTVFEKSDRIGGLLRYGIPEFKMEKRVLDRRLDLLTAEGVVFRAGVNVGVDVTAQDLRRDFDAVLLAGGAGRPRDLDVPGRELEGRPLRDGVPDAAEPPLPGRRVPAGAIDHRRRQARRSSSAAATPAPIASAPCIARAPRRSPARTAAVAAAAARGRQPVAAVAEHLPHLVRARRRRRSRLRRCDHRVHRRCRRPGPRAARPRVSRVVTDGRVSFEPVPDSAFEMKADLVLLAMGFVGPEKSRLLDRSRRPPERARQGRGATSSG